MLPLTPHVNRFRRERSGSQAENPALEVQTPKSAQSKGLETPGARKALGDISNARSAARNITNSQSLFGAENVPGRSLFGNSSTPSSFIPCEVDPDTGCAASGFGPGQRLMRDPQTPLRSSKLLQVFNEDDEDPSISELPEIDGFCDAQSEEPSEEYFNAMGCGDIGDPGNLLSSLLRDNAQVQREGHAKDALAWGLPTDKDMMQVDEAPQGLWSPPPPVSFQLQVRQVPLSPFKPSLPPMIFDTAMGNCCFDKF
eukprot:gnl/MRDRNA2_/MRDRNA2_92957_c0_seq1.p1 gnl/MRDRNA2_/MRDRNA2_92957_c0~~gnl/MRDRNA2_/MRDRNA2_92957_c0_seq1.p1  ORF type:complete len:255 (-),score=57.06 gnl/MRDRNA2_/MRDRNA2_92957_c0_seq1:158-922(-)